MEKAKVAILLSTYNGHEYLKEQIESIQNQSFENWQLYIRDDGSEDDTQDIVKQFQKKDKRITFINENSVQNVGVVRSFFELLKFAKADFYMFSDQDDYWKRDKVRICLERMLKLDYRKKPICVYSNLQVVNEKLEGDKPLLTRNWQDFTKLIFTNNVYGCTMMINDKLKSYVKFNEMNINNIFMHDWWLTLIAAEFGEISYIDEKTILYRQHGDNQVGATKKSARAILKRLVRQERDRKAMKESVGLAVEFLHEYGSQVNGRDKKYLLGYGQLFEKSSFLHNFILGIKLPPQSIYKLKEFFYFYILTIYNKDYRK